MTDFVDERVAEVASDYDGQAVWNWTYSAQGPLFFPFL